MTGDGAYDDIAIPDRQGVWRAAHHNPPMKAFADHLRKVRISSADAMRKLYRRIPLTTKWITKDALESIHGGDLE